MAGYGTSFLEAEALLALQSEDYAHARDQLRQMNRSELRALWQACDRLSDLAVHAYEELVRAAS
jgi:hypothetical protein